MRILIDMNLTVRWVQYLIEAGYESLHWSNVGDPRASDRDICAYANLR